MAKKKQSKKKKRKKESKEKKKTSHLAIVRVRGKIHLTAPIKKTLDMLNLHNKNWCTVFPDNDSVRGMISKVKDYVTWGEISESFFKELVKERGEEFNDRTEDSKGKVKYGNFFTHNKKNYKKYFRLSPPKKGYGRKGVKISFSEGGALGYRGKKIEDLISRMM